MCNQLTEAKRIHIIETQQDRIPADTPSQKLAALKMAVKSGESWLAFCTDRGDKEAIAKAQAMLDRKRVELAYLEAAGTNHPDPFEFMPERK